MDKFIYAVSNFNKKSNKVKVICAKHLDDAKDRIIQEYWDKYDDIEEDEWEKFLIELCNKHGVLISKELTEIEEL